MQNLKLSKSEQDLRNRVIAALVGAKADDLLDDGASLHHAIHEAAMRQVDELRTQRVADRLRKQTRARR